jgi:adenylyltransferase/sulfurtransferase
VSSASVVVVGAGALGCALLPRLARLPVARIVIIDGDTVEAGNLGRQPLYAAVDIGHPKASTARGWVALMAPGCTVRAIDRFVDQGNVEEVIAGAQVVADCTDDLHAKALLDRACAKLCIPLVSGAVHGGQGQMLVLHAPGPGEALGRADIFAGRPGPEQDGCDMRDVPMETIEAVGRRMSQRIKAMVQGEAVTNAVLELFDPRSGRWTNYSVGTA